MKYRNITSLFILAIFFVYSGLASANLPAVLFEKPLSSRIANYSIKVSLDEKLNLLDGQQTLLWYNKTQKSTDELQFHLYLNGFRNSESTLLTEGRNRHGKKLKGDDIWGFIDITRFATRHLTEDETKISYRSSQEWPELKNMVDMADRIEFHHPDDDNFEDKTVIRIQLDKAIQAGGAILIDLDFIARLPSPPIDRVGAKAEYFFVSQWFPKIGVLQEDGWNCHQFHVESEFFADFGTYDVWLDVPADSIVGATGIEVSVSDEKDKRKTHYYHAEDVHDFAWTASSEFVEFSGKSQDVAIRVLMQPDHKNQGQRHLTAAKHAVHYFQDWYGDYPFPNLTVVDPRRGASRSGGMEYPTLITIGTRYGIPEGIRSPEKTIIHEFAHNYWYHLLASNEFEESWLDEGLATYTEMQISHDLYGPKGDSINFFGIKLNGLESRRNFYQRMPDYDPTVVDTWKYYSPSSFGVNSYSKPGLFLETLKNYLGADVMRNILRTYVKRFSFRHPTSRDFTDIASEIANQDLNWFFDQALYSNDILDYAVSDIESVEVKAPKGFDYSLSIEDIRSDKPNSEENDKEIQLEDEPIYYSTVSIRRIGDFIFPVEAEIIFENGDVIQEQWDGKALWTRYNYMKNSKLRSVTVDPKGKIPLDINLTNNSKTLESNNKAVMRQTASWFERLQIIADLLAF